MGRLSEAPIYIVMPLVLQSWIRTKARRLSRARAWINSYRLLALMQGHNSETEFRKFRRNLRALKTLVN